LRHDAQLALFHELKRYYNELPFGTRRRLRYTFDNTQYGHSDAIILYSLIRHLRPRSIVEIGCGYSSCVILDTVELFFDGAVDCTFIDPEPDALISLLKRGDCPRIIGGRVQDIPESLFTVLESNDILFIDSTHVLKAGSDVNHVLFEVLPILKSGVHIHFHDIFYPFEYPRAWLQDLGLAWNEIYALRAFLQYNEQFEIAFINTYLEQLHEELFRREMPLCLLNPGGSLWLRRR
jgi:predicted O-methyltransferase YrrM